jgi:hypothetical protein
MISLPASASQNFTFQGEFLGQFNQRYFNSYGPNSLTPSNESYSSSPCGEAVLPVNCFVWSATYTNPSATQGNGMIPHVDASVTDWQGATIILAPNETRDITLRGQFVGYFLYIFFDASPGGLDVTNSNFSYELCDGGASSLASLNSDNAAAPTALYIFPEADNLLHIYAIDPVTATGVFAYSVTALEIEQMSFRAVETGQNLLIAEGMNISLYALSSGECQVNGYFADGKLYEYIFPCPVATPFLSN